MEPLRVRIYQVRFGDAILVSVPDRDAAGGPLTRHILIDVGNATSTTGGIDTLFKPVVQDILQVLDGRPLDLYIMTHEHMDHVQGLLYARGDYGDGGLEQKLNCQHAWLTSSADPDYYRQPGHEKARKQKLAFDAAHRTIDGYLAAAPGAHSPFVDALIAVNSLKILDYVNYLRNLAQQTWYVDRETDLAGKHPFLDATFDVWAPENDVSIYYSTILPMALGLSPVGEAATPVPVIPDPPPGVDAGAFYDLVQSRAGFLDNLLAIDKAANNTSLVFCLTWHSWRLLFSGDAEQRSWRQMKKVGKLAAVDFLKVAHHGSATGNPPPDLLEDLLPRPAAGAVNRHAAVSTFTDGHDRPYHGVPDPGTEGQLRQHAALCSTFDPAINLYLELSFASDRREVDVVRC